MISVLAAAALSPIAARLVSIEPNLAFPDAGHSTVQQFGPFDAGMDFNEAIVSWNVEHPDLAAVKVEARIVDADSKSKWFVLADWAANTALHPRVSVEKQRDPIGDVSTDTLHLSKTARQLEVSVTLHTLADGERPKLKFLAISFANTAIRGEDVVAPGPSWGKTIEVPQRAQNNYPNGGVLCSATSVSMMLWHYSKVLDRPELDHDVPAVEAAVWDSVYKGAGNWPFNTAFAGSFPGMRAYVARFDSIQDLERWIDKGLPVVCSVSFLMLQGKPLEASESGHLVVLVGFTKDGDPVFNDPAWKAHVRTTYKRSDFEKAWAYSHRTVYLIYPEASQTDDPGHLWAG